MVLFESDTGWFNIKFGKYVIFTEVDELLNPNEYSSRTEVTMAC